MLIQYVTRSRFLAKCEAVIKEGLSDLRKGVTLRIDFESGGYNNRVLVTIDLANHNEFSTNWNQNDPSRFPARIKAAATALHNCSCAGQYEIEHNDGVLTIKQR
jgi:hypothetical protein